MSLSDKELQRLKESEEKYRKMVEMANDAIFGIDPDSGDIVFANKKAEQMCGYSARDLVGMRVWELHPPEEQLQAKQLFKEVVDLGSSYLREMHFVRGDGSRLTVDVSAVVISYGDKKVIQRICRDVTKRRELQKREEHLRQYYEQILNMMPVGLGVKKDISSQPAVEFENRKLKDMFHGGAEDAEHCHWHWHESTEHGEDKARMSLNEDGVYAEERRFSDGHVYQFTISYFRDLEDRWRELQVVQDVSERRRLEDELRRINDELEKKVEERTRELREKQTQLAQTEKMAALGNLVAGVAHEINTPLGALNSNNDVFVRLIGKLRRILGELEACGELKDHPELAAVFENVEKLNEINQTAADRIVNIVNSLRRFARLDRAEKDTVDIHEGLETTLTLVNHELKNRIDVIKSFGDIPRISCFPNQLNQVFMNLLVNASQAIEGTGKITIKTYAQDSQVVIEVSDTGRGITPEHLKRVFDPGFTTKGTGVGTGLGLSIVHQIIQEHGGRIEVESEPGKGTTFRLILPVR